MKPFRGSKVQGSRFYFFLPRTAFGMRIYEKIASFARLDPKFGAKLAIAWANEQFNEVLWSSIASLSLTRNVEPLTCEPYKIIY